MGTPTRPTDTANDREASERARRWRLVLGSDADESAGVSLTGIDVGMDQALQALYGSSGSEGWRPRPRAPRRAGKLGAFGGAVAWRHPNVLSVVGRARFRGSIPTRYMV